MNLKNKDLYIVLESKVCTSCDESKMMSEYRKDKTSYDGLTQKCKPCFSIYQKEWYEKNKEKQKTNAKEYRKKNPLSHFQSHIKRKYGITLEDYNSMFISQGGCCAICNTHQKDIEKRLSVDHCHNSGNVRGLLCNSCNTSIGLLKEDVGILNAAIEYLNGFDRFE
jgi:hypothetical protein